MSTRQYSSRQFSRFIADDVFSGHGFVPFVGSGLSAPSGILMGQEFGNYLAYSVWRVVGDDTKHNLPLDGWPKYPRDEEVETVKKWTKQKFTEICDDYECKPVEDNEQLIRSIEFKDANSTEKQLWASRRPLIPQIIQSSDEFTWKTESQTQRYQDQHRGPLEWARHAESGPYSRTSARFVMERAIRSMYDWRSMLQFLSQIKIIRGAIELQEEVDGSIIDSFNAHITQDRQINLGHKMLAHLSGPLRIRSILTTNFDNLIETAFRKLHRPLNVLSVGTQGEMPNPKSVRSKDSIVKLHGELTDTRADFSLDIEPTLEEKKTFASYVRGEFDSSSETAPIPNQLLVLGFSGRDVRIIQLMKFLLDKHPTVKLYWVCHGTHEPDQVSGYFGKEYESRLIIHQTVRPDLLLYELYQHITLSLPSGGFAYEFTHKVPPQRISHEDGNERVTFEELESGKTLSPDPQFGLNQDILKRKNAKNKIAIAIGENIIDAVLNPRNAGETDEYRYPQKKSVGMAQLKWTTSRAKPHESNLVQARLFFSSGSASAMRHAFQELSNKNYHCLWLELQDYTSPEELLQDLLRIIALRVGSYQLEHVVLLPETKIRRIRSKLEIEIEHTADRIIDLQEQPSSPQTEAKIIKLKRKHKELLIDIVKAIDGDLKSLDDHLERLLKFLRISHGKWSLFFYGRSIAGAASGFLNRPWNACQLETFRQYLNVLTRHGFHTVYSPMTNARATDESDKNTKSDFYYRRDLALNGVEKEVPTTFEDSYGRALQKSKERLNLQSRLIKKQLIGQQAPSLHKRKDLSIFKSLQDNIVEKWIRPQSKARTLEEARSEARRYYQKLRFLYASTLFRQSRHTSAFFSDAVFPCPWKFNVRGLDNDWVRSFEVRDWVAQLGSLDVFFYKPGGYSWKYRDTRMGIQTKLEAIPFAKINKAIFETIYQYVPRQEKDIKNELEELNPLSFAIQIRARAHFDIANWYWKAFNATGHYLPFIEAQYHYFEALDFIEFARPISREFERQEENDPTLPSTVFNYRINLARSCMMNMIKSLKTARPWVKFWLAGVNGHEIFEFNQLVARFARARNELADKEDRKPWVPQLDSALKMLESDMKAMQSSLKSEAGNYVPKPSDLEYSPDVSLDKFSNDYFDIVHPPNQDIVDPPNLDIGTGNTVWQVDFDQGFKKWFVDEAFATTFQEKTVTTGQSRNESKFPFEEIRKLLFEFYENHGSDPRITSRKISRFMAIWINGNLRTRWACPNCYRTIETRKKTCPRCKQNVGKEKLERTGFDESAVLFVVELLSDYAYLFLKRAKLERAANTDPVKRRRRWVKVCMVCSIALDLCKHLHPSFLIRERRQQIKLHTIYGLALAYLGRPLEANRRFNDAESILSKESRTPDEVETAIIRLRRAEATLVRAELTSNIIDAWPNLALAEHRKFASGSGRLGMKIDPASKRFRQSIEEWISLSDFSVLDFVKHTEENLSKFLGFDQSAFARTKICLRNKRVSDIANTQTILADPVVRQEISKWLDINEGLKAPECFQTLSTTLSRLHSAFLDDAWVYIESAERLLAGFSQSSLWWSRVASLKLRAYAMIRPDARFESLVFRKRIQHDTVILELKRRLLLNDPTDNYAKVRCVARTAKAMSAITNQNFITKSKYSQERWEELSKLLIDVGEEWLSTFGNSVPELLQRALDNAKEILKHSQADYKRR